ncbi:unnamed protein product [Candidula unifasciata]|uniref:Uncharacterized protein n=1 Tax=Candidula unifasciata TaxID=100452 RepID=A0A8S3YEE7_9EUPU|nr:unnamed protein product [Candidula unifasciata]
MPNQTSSLPTLHLATHRVCVPGNENRLCPGKKPLCPGGCKPGFCLNSQCVCNTRPEMFHCNPQVEREAEFHRQRIESAVKQQKNLDRQAFLASERKSMGMREPDEEAKKLPTWYKTEETHSGQTSAAAQPLEDFKCQRTMRAPARPSCMLTATEIHPAYDDLSQLSLFLRTSTMPGYGPGGVVSEYQDTYNMAVWDGKRDLDRQLYKLKHDWLSIWGEQNVKDQRWRKGWLEKDALKK